ncbi:hypothetical protein J3A83DRAFT_4088626 [Scleroderma citrinum]
MSQLRTLVVFDAKIAMCNSHFVNIIKRFYCSTGVNVRPRILALCTTMGPADVYELEQLLDAKVARGLPAENDRFRPTEVVIQYEAAFSVSDTKLTEQIRLLNSSESMFSTTFAAARHVLNELGPCASDLTWRRAMKENTLTAEHESDSASASEIIAAVHRLVKNWIFSMPNVNPSSRGFNVTPKLARLVQLLKIHESYGDRFRGIILVGRRAVATAMADMLCTLTDDLAFLRPLALIGQLPLINQQAQHDVCRSFSTGKHNLLIITRALEDLDIPVATLVVRRYDVFESQLSYAYTCARTARPLGCVVHMVENGNDAQRRVLSHFIGDMFDERWIEVVMNGGNAPIPPQPLKEHFQPAEEQDASVGPYIEDPTTSGRLHERDAICALYRFISKTCRASRSSTNALLTVWQTSGGNLPEWVCNVLLPPGLLMASISGPPRSTPTHARRAAAFIACMQLYEHGIFDHRIFPHPLSLTSFEDTQPTAITHNVSGSRRYPRKRTQFWSNSIRLFSGRWFPVVICIQGLADYSPILLLTRQPLPHIASFRLFFEGVAGVVQNTRCAPVEISADRLHALHLFTIRICRSILNKPFACSVDDMAYMFAPLNPSVTSDCSPRQILDRVPWDLVSLAGKEWAVPFSAEDLRSEGIEDMVVQDRMVEFTRRYYILHLRRDLTPLSKPEGSPRETGYINFVEYCKARKKGFEGLRDYQQPMIELSRVASVCNHLNPTFRRHTEPVRAVAKYLIPELSSKFTIPAGTFRTALVLPSIMRRIDDYLVVQELNAKFFNHTVHEELLLAAISTPSAGYEMDYERLELFGDSFLKYLASIYVFVMNPAQHEGALHATRQRIISNKVLMESADRTGLLQYIQGKPFGYKHWHPPNFTISPLPGPNATEHGMIGDENKRVPNDDPAVCITRCDVNPPRMQAPKKRSLDDSMTQWLGDKTIADVVEAIIGAAYLCGGQENALQVAKALQVPIPHAEQWDDLRRKAPLLSPNPAAPLRTGTVESVEAIIGHDFCHPHVLRSALIHASVEGYDATYYERLEFIGDAILDFMVVRYIFGRDEKLSPGAMTMLKGAMVSNSVLAAVCVSSGLYKHLHYDSYPLGSSFAAYVERLELRRLQEIESATRQERSPGQYWLDIEPPKALSDLVESLIGALFISDGYQPIGTEVFFNKVLKPFYDQHITLKTLSHHPTKILFELLQKHGCQHFEMVKERCDSRQETRCDVVVHDIILASATATTVNTASRAASLTALDALEGDPDFMNGTCACRSGTQGKRVVLIEEMLAQVEAEPTP